MILTINQILVLRRLGIQNAPVPPMAGIKERNHFMSQIGSTRDAQESDTSQGTEQVSHRQGTNISTSTAFLSKTGSQSFKKTIIREGEA